MGTFFILLSHAVTVLGIVALIYGAQHAIVSTRSIEERIIRAMAITAGAFAYLAAKAIGVPLPVLFVDAIAGGKWFSLTFLGVVIPSLAGFFLIRYIRSCMKKHDAIAVRVMLMVSSLVLIMFGDVYLAAAGQAKLDELRPLLPNVMFVLTMMCYLVFEYRPKDPSKLE